MLSIRILLFVVVVAFAVMPVRAEDAAGSEKSPAAEAAVGICEHGVKKSICARCNPKLEAVFKAKNDWCAEHTRPESQCVICHPELSQQGIK